MCGSRVTKATCNKSSGVLVTFSRTCSRRPTRTARLTPENCSEIFKVQFLSFRKMFQPPPFFFLCGFFPTGTPFPRAPRMNSIPLFRHTAQLLKQTVPIGSAEQTYTNNDHTNALTSFWGSLCDSVLANTCDLHNKAVLFCLWHYKQLQRI